MHVGVDCAGGRDHALTGDDRRAGADHDLDVVDHVGIAGSADSANASVANADRDLADSAGRIDDDHVGDHDVARVLDCCRLQHQPVTCCLGESGDELVAAQLGVVFDLDDQARVAQANAVTDRRTVYGGVIVRQDLVGVKVVVGHFTIVMTVGELAVRVTVVAHGCAPR